MSVVRFSTREALNATLEEWCLKLVNPVSKFRGGMIRLPVGSTVVWVEAQEFGPEHFGVLVSGNVLHNVAHSDELALELLTSDHFNEYYTGSWAVTEWHEDPSTFLLDYRVCLFANQLDEAELEAAILLVAHVADQHDEELQAKYGGKLWSEL